MKLFRLERRINYYDTDKMGIVYHVNYIKFFHEARTAFLRHEGYPHSEMEKQKLQTPVLDVSAKFRSPCYYDEVITVECAMTKLGPASAEFYYEIRNAETGELKVTGQSKHGFLDENFRPIALKKKYPDIYNFLEQTVKKYAPKKGITT